MKTHIGVDSRTKLIHTMQVSAANVADEEALPTCCMDARRASGAIRATRGERVMEARTA